VIASESFVSKLCTDEVTASGKRRDAISRKLFLQITTACELVADFVTCAASIFVVSVLQVRFTDSAQYSFHQLLGISVVCGLLAVLLLQRKGTDSKWAHLHPVWETAGAVRMSLQALLFILPGSFLLKLEVPRSVIVLAFLLMPPLLALQKYMTAFLAQRLHSRYTVVERVVIYGACEAGRRIASGLLSSPRLGLRPVAVIHEDPGSIDECRLELAYGGHTIPVQCASMTASLLESLQCDLVILGVPNLPLKEGNELRAVVRQVGIPVAHLSDPLVPEGGPRESIEIGGLSLIHEEPADVAWNYAFTKRVLDIAVSSILLVVLSPAFIVIVLLIRLTSPGPALFVQRRVGRAGKLFNMYKFRSMSSRARKYECSPKISSDPRITRVGRLLRLTSLDELPQLMNVFLGQMSLVGPRPEMPFIVRRYSEYQRRRLQVTPGITGLWQLSQDRAFPIHENLHHDLSYIRNRTLCMDLAILIHTLFFSMCGGV